MICITCRTPVHQSADRGLLYHDNPADTLACPAPRVRACPAEDMTTAELEVAREDALYAFRAASNAVFAHYNELAVLRYPSSEYAVLQAQLPALKDNLLRTSAELTVLHNEQDRRYRTDVPAPLDWPIDYAKSAR